MNESFFTKTSKYYLKITRLKSLDSFILSFKIHSLRKLTEKVISKRWSTQFRCARLINPKTI